MMWTCRGPNKPFIFRESTVVDKITEAVNSQKLLHLVPLARNFVAVDSIIYDPNDPKACFTCIQVTRNPDHDITVSDLQHIESWLRLKSPLKDIPLAKPGRGAFYSLCRLTWCINMY
jgi:hypothetical protein